MATPPDTVWYTSITSPIGELLLLSQGGAVRGLSMQESPRPIAIRPEWRRSESAEPFAEMTSQLGEYFDGRRTAFDLPLTLAGTPFQQQVWRALLGIPYGTTVSYGQLAGQIEQPKASRAVGLANGRNPIAVIVPCHRVIGSNGTLTGYGGGLARKQILLDLEASVGAHDARRDGAPGNGAPGRQPALFT